MFGFFCHIIKPIYSYLSLNWSAYFTCIIYKKFSLFILIFTRVSLSLSLSLLLTQPLVLFDCVFFNRSPSKIKTSCLVQFACGQCSVSLQLNFFFFLKRLLKRQQTNDKPHHRTTTTTINSFTFIIVNSGQKKNRLSVQLRNYSSFKSTFLWFMHSKPALD